MVTLIHAFIIDALTITSMMSDFQKIPRFRIYCFLGTTCIVIVVKNLKRPQQYRQDLTLERRAMNVTKSMQP